MDLNFKASRSAVQTVYDLVVRNGCQTTPTGMEGLISYRKSIRLKGWDYRREACYFITICTKNRKPVFGEIREGTMGLTVQGCIAWHFWRLIPHHTQNVFLDEFVVMPNHVHMIIGIGAEDEYSRPPNKESQKMSVGTCHGMSLQTNGGRKFGKPRAKSISMIVNHYKGAITRWCNMHGYEMAWQSRFHDHIIRDEESLNRIREYIRGNPANWDTDSENIY